jgi:hypothetical protein
MPHFLNYVACFWKKSMPHFLNYVSCFWKKSMPHFLNYVSCFWKKSRTHFLNYVSCFWKKSRTHFLNYVSCFWKKSMPHFLYYVSCFWKKARHIFYIMYRASEKYLWLKMCGTKCTKLWCHIYLIFNPYDLRLTTFFTVPIIFSDATKEEYSIITHFVFQLVTFYYMTLF